tara:strand:- start:118 stop:936 length:819 start_codon:yes stop_codon:yes gene_type:complete
MKIHLVVVLLLFNSFFNESAHASNNFFLPGDSYFCASLIIENIQLNNNSDILFEYSFPDTPRSFSGYAGYQHLRWESVGMEYQKNISMTYELARLRKPPLYKEYTEYKTTFDNGDIILEIGNQGKRLTNPLRMFIYNENFEYKKFPLFLKYNENWVDNGKLFGFAKTFSTFTLDPFITTPTGIEQSWKYSQSVQPLQADCPPVPEESHHKRVLTPVVFTGDAILIIPLFDNLNDYFQIQKQFEFYVISKNGIYLCTRQDGVITESPPPRIRK